MGLPEKGQSLDRIDNNGDYRPGNCRWAYQNQQNRNQRSNVLIRFRGLEFIASDFAKLVGAYPADIINHRDRGPDGVDKFINRFCSPFNLSEEERSDLKASILEVKRRG